MRTAFFVLPAVLSATAVAHADEPTQLPKKCVADSPTDRPCTSFEGTYRLKFAPIETDKKCFITAPLEADVTIGEPTEYGYVELDAKGLLRKLGWKQGPHDEYKASAAVRKGVCCVDLRLIHSTGKQGNKIEHRLDIDLAVGDSKINGEAEERITRDRGDDCQYDLAFEGKIVRKR